MPISSDPLHRLRVAVTRPSDAAGEMAAMLADAGAVPLVMPLVEVRPVADLSGLLHALEQEYDWAAFTSANAVRVVAGAVQDHRATLAAERVAAVGRGTNDALVKRLGRAADVVPVSFTGQHLAEAMREAAGSLIGARVLWPRAASAREAFPDALQQAGALLHDVPVYETISRRDIADELAGMLRRGDVDVLTFTSPSAVTALREAGGTVDDVIVAVIGSTTAAAAAELGYRVDVRSPDAGIPGLVEALRAHVQGTPGRAGL